MFTSSKKFSHFQYIAKWTKVLVLKTQIFSCPVSPLGQQSVSLDFQNKRLKKIATLTPEGLRRAWGHLRTRTESPLLLTPAVCWTSECADWADFCSWFWLTVWIDLPVYWPPTSLHRQIPLKHLIILWRGILGSLKHVGETQNGDQISFQCDSKCSK